MTAIYQRLPSFKIPENPSYASEYCSQYVSRQSSLLAEGFNIYGSPEIKSDENKDQQRLPPINRFHGFGKGSGPPLWAYGTPQLTPQLIQLVFGGNVPKIYGKQWQIDKNICNFPKVGKNSQSVDRKTELWYPKNWKKCQVDGRRTEQKILNARWRQRQIFDAISLKLNENRKPAENVLLKKAGTMERGKQAYLAKMDKNAEKIKQNRKMFRRKKTSNPPADGPTDKVQSSNPSGEDTVSDVTCDFKTSVENSDTMDEKATECDEVTSAVEKEPESVLSELLDISEDSFKTENASEPLDDKLTVSEEQVVTTAEAEQILDMADEKSTIETEGI